VDIVKGVKLLENSITCKKCGNSTFYFSGYFENESDSPLIKPDNSDVLEYECCVCKEKNRICILPNKKVES